MGRRRHSFRNYSRILTRAEWLDRLERHQSLDLGFPF